MRSKTNAHRLNRLSSIFQLLKNTLYLVTKNHRGSINLDILSIDSDNKKVSIELRFENIRPNNTSNLLLLALSLFQSDIRSRGVGIEVESKDERGNLVLNLTID